MNPRSCRVEVPASSANLGPGFDSFAAALDLTLELEVRESPEGFSVDVGSLELPTDRENLCVRAFELISPADEVAFAIGSDIPLAGGLGSSAAATVAGLFAANELGGLGLSPEAVLEKASGLEGHPDNAAASIYGGFVICDPGADGGLVRLEVPEGVEGILVVPTADRVPTSEARAALPEEVPLEEASENISSAARLALGIERSDAELIAAGLRDRLHQKRREHLYPRSMEIVAEAPSMGALGATISGAGPTVLVWARSGESDQVLEALASAAEGWAEVRRVPFRATGAEVSSPQSA